MRHIFIAITLLGIVSFARADGLDIFLNNNTVSVDYLSTFRGSDINIGYLYNSNSDWVANIGLLVFGRDYGSDSKIEGGLGGKFYLSSVGNNSVMAMGIGGQATYFPRSSKFGVGGYLYYAPDIVTFTGRSFLEYGVRGEFQLVETASAYLGIHRITAEPDSGGAVTIDDGIHVGINLRF